MDGHMNLSSVLSITLEALRIQADRTQMMWEEDRSLLMRGISFLRDEIDELRQFRSPLTPVALPSPVSAVRTHVPPVQMPEGKDAQGQGHEQLVSELRRCQDENLALTRKNDTLKYNFFFLEDKYKKLRGQVQDAVPLVQAPRSRSDKKRPATAMKDKEEGQVEVEVEVAQGNSKSAGTAAGDGDRDEGGRRAPKRRNTEMPLTTSSGANTTAAAAASRAMLSVKPDSRALRRVQTAPLAQSAAPQPFVDKITEVVRNKAERAALAGHTCDECREFYGILMEQGFIKPDELQGYLQECSRHKAKFSPDKTPAGFWDDSAFSMPTPEEQQQRLCAKNHAATRTQMQKTGDARP